MTIRDLKKLKGWSQREIARELDIDRGTATKYLKSGELPKYKRKAPYPSILDPYK